MGGGTVIGVLAGCGGAGASVFAAVLAGCAAAAGPSLLVDCDAMGGGIDVLLGCEQVPGPRWRQVRLGGGDLDSGVLLGSLPRWEDACFLAADDTAELDPDTVRTVVEAGAQQATVVLDLPRWPSKLRATALACCDRILLVVPAEVRAVTAAAFLASGLPPDRTAVAVRGVCRSLPADRIGSLLGVTLVGHLPYDPASLRPGGLQLSRIRRGTRALAQTVLTASPVTESAA
jgi:secretion/DNA translocation related CpaE-like protein